MARPLNISLLESSFKVLAPQGELLVERSYQFLFDEYPQVKPLFINTDPKSQQKKLFVELSLVISNLITSDTLSAALQGYSKNSGAGTGDHSRFRRETGGVGQITSAMQQLDQVSQTNAAASGQ